MKILVLSDLHAFTPNDAVGGRAPSILVNSKSGDRGVVNPISLIPEVLRDEGLEVDWILCPGDIADRADPDAQEFAWRALTGLKQEVGARLLLATAGNHDLDSRLKHSQYDPKGALQALVPPFPGLDNETCDKYWSRNFHIHIENGIRLVNLNSAAFHGYSSEDEVKNPEFMHGRVSERTISNIEEALRGEDCELNILFTHHHIYKDDRIYDEDYSEMKYGSRLVDRLTELTLSSWLVIHGHQHYPEIRYGPGKAHLPVLFSSGSVSAVIDAPYSSEAPNQFYHVTLFPDRDDTNNWTPCGVVRAWHWELRKHWQRTPRNFNIPYGYGFGCRTGALELAQRVKKTMEEQSQPLLEGKDVFAHIPEMKFLLKEGFDEVIKHLAGLGVKYSQGEIPNESVFRLAQTP
ncbi:metallophosphoesterase family protein [Nitratireductor thuwali]|uniref:3',5'-cyclic adenosine monophosphate phosphodiesterase CpdA n=1 Tax=Nitratireductor thuwali TaxID=2267699 RepID=A0ABY5MMB9_9HYPH|nr:3',5'-cyclic adenosine monophosphate phosphodiesterase CpdA [Nitratireductor thuwali]